MAFVQFVYQMPAECQCISQIIFLIVVVAQNIRIVYSVFIKRRMLSLIFLASQRQTRDVVATLALSLCKLRGVPLLNDRDLDALLQSPTVRNETEVPAATRDDRIDELILQLDRLILERTR